MAQDFRGNSNLPIGLRNNNPTNIVPVAGGWQGQVGTDGGFATFQDVSWGIRAYVKNLNSSINNHGTATLSEYITRFAPPSENDTASYIASVAKDTGLSADSTLQTDPDSIKKLLRAQMNVELGKKYADMVSDADISEGISLANGGAATLFKATKIFASSHVGYLVVLAGIGGMAAIYLGLSKKKN